MISSNNHDRVMGMIEYHRELILVGGLHKSEAFSEVDRLYENGICVHKDQRRPFWGKYFLICSFCDPNTCHTDAAIQSHIQTKEHKAKLGMYKNLEDYSIESVLQNYSHFKQARQLLEYVQRAKASRTRQLEREVQATWIIHVEVKEKNTLYIPE